MKQIEVVAAIIRRKDKIFATQRGYGEWKDWWEFPGGKMEAGETEKIKEFNFRKLIAPQISQIKQIKCPMIMKYQTKSDSQRQGNPCNPCNLW